MRLIIKYIMAIAPALACLSCAEEVKEVDTTGAIRIIVPSGDGSCSFPAVGGTIRLGIDSRLDDWTADIDWKKGSAGWCGVDKISGTELSVKVYPNYNEDPCVFESREAEIVVYSSSHEEISTSCPLKQAAYVPRLDLIPNDDADKDGLETGFNVPVEGKRYEFIVKSNFPPELTESRGEVETELVMNRPEGPDMDYSGTLTVVFSGNAEVTAHTVELTVGNTLTCDGMETPVFKTLVFNQSPAEKYIKLEAPADNEYAYSGAFFEFTVDANHPWTVTSDSDCLSFSRNQGGAGKTIVTADLAANMDDLARTVTVSVAGSGDTAPVTFTVEQRKFSGIRYTTVDGKKLMIAEASLKTTAHVYEDGVGRIAMQEGWSQIPPGMFSGCATIKTIALPESVMDIGNSAFSECSALETIEMNSHLDRIGNSVFYDCIALKSIDWPSVDGYSAVTAQAFYNCKSLEKIVLPEGIDAIEKQAFMDCERLADVVFNNPDDEFSLGKGAFSFCRALASIDLPDGLTVIPDNAFAGCLLLSSVTMGDKVTKIGDFAFSMCHRLGEIDLPASVTEIGRGAFQNQGMGGLKHFVFPPGVTNVQNNLFQLSVIYSVDMTSAPIAYISSEAFGGCANLTRVTIPATVGKIGYSAFWGCEGLESVTCLAQSPPELTECMFKERPFPELSNPLDNPGFRIYVPASAIEQYRKADFWKDYPLEPIE